MAHEKRAAWTARIGRWNSSGLSATAFAAREGVNPRTLAYWCLRLRRAGGSTRLPAPARTPFVEVVVPPVEPALVGDIEIVLRAGYRVRVGERVAAERLCTVLDILEARG
jgi:hypothetical protein